MDKAAVAILLISVATVSAQTFTFGKCPVATPQSQFQLSNYLGKWYEIYKIPALFENGQSCITANYSLKADGHIQVLNQGLKEGKPISALGDAKRTDTSHPAQLAVRFSDKAPYGPYWVLDTDYTGHTVIFSCESLGGLFHAQFAWILSRTPTISDDLQKSLFQILQKNGVNTSLLVKTEQTACPGRK